MRREAAIGGMNWAAILDSLSLRQRFNRDVLWNVAGLAVAGIAGVVLNIVIGRAYGKNALGIFNQVYAIYIILSQLSVGGVHSSVLKHISYIQDDREKCSQIMTSALLLTAVVALIGCIAAWWGRELLRLLDYSDGVIGGIVYVIPGLFFFSLNKVFLNVVNAARNMRAYAVFFALRFVLILLGILILIRLDVPQHMLALSFSTAEAALTIGLAAYTTIRLYPLRWPRNLASWLKEHLSFGVRGMFSGLISDLNTRVDVLMLGYFLGDGPAGVYTMGATLAEGFFQLPYIVQRNVNPLLGQAFAANDRERIEAMARRTRRVLHPAMLALAVVAAACYPVVIWIAGEEFAPSWPVFGILIAGVVLHAGYMPMGGILFQGGRPEWHTWLMVIAVLANVAANLLLIPLMGINGAALATALSYVLQAVLLLAFAKRLFGVRLWR